VETEFEVVEAGSIIDSSQKEYAAELQPRNRDRKASEIQVSQMSRNLNPELLEDSKNAGDGAPIVGKDGMVESGNGRTMAIKQAYSNFNAQAHRDYLEANKDRFGVDLSGIDNPILIRKRLTGLDRVQFAREANQNNRLNMSPVEQAQDDAEGVLSEHLLSLFATNENGDIDSVANQDFIKGFLKHIPQTELSEITTKDGLLNTRGLERVRNAVFYKAYGNSKLIEMVAEDTGNKAARVVKALVTLAPKFAKLNSTDVSHIARGAELYATMRAQGKNIQAEKTQESMFDDVDTDAMLWADFFDTNIQSGKRITTGLNAAADIIEDGESLKDMDDMFGKRKATNTEVYNHAKEAIEKANLGSSSIFCAVSRNNLTFSTYCFFFQLLLPFGGTSSLMDLIIANERGSAPCSANF